VQEFLLWSARGRTQAGETIVRVGKRRHRDRCMKLQLDAVTPSVKERQARTVVAVAVLVPLTLGVELALAVAVELELAVSDAVADGDPDAVEDLEGVDDVDGVSVGLALAVRVAVLDGEAELVKVEDALMDPVSVADALEVPLALSLADALPVAVCSMCNREKRTDQSNPASGGSNSRRGKRHHPGGRESNTLGRWLPGRCSCLPRWVGASVAHLSGRRCA